MSQAEYEQGSQTGYSIQYGLFFLFIVYSFLFLWFEATIEINVDLEFL